jgi:hypothetical protein
VLARPKTEFRKESFSYDGTFLGNKFSIDAKIDQLSVLFSSCAFLYSVARPHGNQYFVVGASVLK